MQDQYHGQLKPGIDYTGILLSLWCIDNSYILLEKRSSTLPDEPGKWDFGSGVLNFGEEFEHGLQRILKRKYDCEGQILQQLPAVSSTSVLMGNTTHWVTIPFIIKVKKKDIKINEPLKIDELSWFGVYEMPVPLHPAAAEALQKNREALSIFTQANHT